MCFRVCQSESNDLVFLFFDLLRETASESAFRSVLHQYGEREVFLELVYFGEDAVRVMEVFNGLDLPGGSPVWVADHEVECGPFECVARTVVTVCLGGFPLGMFDEFRAFQLWCVWDALPQGLLDVLFELDGGE